MISTSPFIIIVICLSLTLQISAQVPSLENTCKCIANNTQATCVAISTLNSCNSGFVCPCSRFAKQGLSCPSDGSSTENRTPCIQVRSTILEQNMCSCIDLGGPVCQDNPDLSTNNCDVNSQVCGCSFRGIQEVEQIGPPLSCISTVQCINTLVSLGGSDPHFTGFDGIRFDFHGEHNHNYIIFAEKDSDILTAKLRATEELNKGVNKTYFDQFGLQIGDEKTPIHIYMDSKSDNHWKMRVKVAGDLLDAGEIIKVPSFKVSFNKNGKAVEINTDHNIFRINTVSMKSDCRHHLDLRVMKVKYDKLPHHYTGILGMTLNRKLGGTVHEEEMRSFDDDKKDNNFSLRLEMAMRRSYEVPIYSHTLMTLVICIPMPIRTHRTELKLHKMHICKDSTEQYALHMYWDMCSNALVLMTELTNTHV